MRMYIDAPSNGRIFGVPVGMQLRDCSVVVVGSTCKICGRDFKCQTDVALHARWRHNAIVNTMDSDTDNHSENTIQKYDIYDKQLENISDLKINKRQINKKQVQDRKRARKVRLIFKIAGVIITEIDLNRKYLKMRNNRYVVNNSTRTNLFEKEKCQDDYIANIDLSLADRVVGRHIQCVRPHTATNRYIVGKFAFTRDNTITRSIDGLGRRSLVEISNTPNQDTTYGFSDDSRKYENHTPSSQEDIKNMFIAKITRNKNIEEDKILRIKEWGRDRENANTTTEDALISKDKIVCSPIETLSSDSNESLSCPRGKPNRKIPVFKRTFFTHNCCDSIGRTNEISENRVISRSTDLLPDPVEIVIDNDNLDRVMTKCSTSSLVRRNIGESTRVDFNIDDDIQEILRITRGKAHDDINHESPNRTEREILVQNAVREMNVSPARLNVVYTTKNDTGSIENNNNISPPDYPLFTNIADNNCQLPTNITALLCKTFDTQLGICFDNHYGIRYYNDLPEINNNRLEEYAIHAHEGSFKPRTLVTESHCPNEFKANDNEATVVID